METVLPGSMFRETETALLLHLRHQAKVPSPFPGTVDRWRFDYRAAHCNLRLLLYATYCRGLKVDQMPGTPLCEVKPWFVLPTVHHSALSDSRVCVVLTNSGQICVKYVFNRYFTEKQRKVCVFRLPQNLRATENYK